MITHVTLTIAILAGLAAASPMSGIQQPDAKPDPLSRLKADERVGVRIFHARDIEEVAKTLSGEDAELAWAIYEIALEARYMEEVLSAVAGPIRFISPADRETMEKSLWYAAMSAARFHQSATRRLSRTVRRGLHPSVSPHAEALRRAITEVFDLVGGDAIIAAADKIHNDLENAVEAYEAKKAQSAEPPAPAAQPPSTPTAAIPPAPPVAAGPQPPPPTALLKSEERWYYIRGFCYSDDAETQIIFYSNSFSVDGDKEDWKDMLQQGESAILDQGLCDPKNNLVVDGYPKAGRLTESEANRDKREMKAEDRRTGGSRGRDIRDFLFTYEG